MKLKFDANQDYQIEAINAVADLFSGQLAAEGEKLLSIKERFLKEGQFEGLESELGAIANNINIPEEQVLENLRQVQERNGLDKSSKVSGMNFSVEMETGTGKTYVYIRTALELNRRYGWKKFIIVVPSIAIKEGVSNAIDTMTDHLKQQYEGVIFNKSVYSSKQLGVVRQFATSTNVEFMITTIDGFKRDNTHMQREQEDLGWYKPIKFLQETRPIVILDEPQNMESDLSIKAIRELHPLMILRYSATHKNEINLVYQLDPVESHQQKLVKSIYVRSVYEQGSTTKPYIKLIDVKMDPNLQAKLDLYVRTQNGLKKQERWIKPYTDLAVLTQNDSYNGYVVQNIIARPGQEAVDVGNEVIDIGSAIGGHTDELMRVQVKETIQAHLEKERSLIGTGIKVLSLFFVERVAHYWEFSEDGTRNKGKVQQWFIEILSEFLKQDRYKDLYPNYTVDDLHGAYFSVLKKKKSGVEEFFDPGESSGDAYKQAENDAYELIMRDKERLLSLDTPLRFIFSHSALKEGWDNPNVFQICMLRVSGNEVDRRQTIGRGLRLPVNQQGERIHDENINQLTVIANEGYAEFAENLQNEYVKDGVQFGRLRTNAFARVVEVDTAKPLGLEKSQKIWNSLHVNEFIDDKGKVLDSFVPDTLGFTLNLDNEFKPLEDQIIDIVASYKLRNIVREDKKRVKLSLNKEILNTQTSEFNKIWNRINKKTKFRVHFNTEELIGAASRAIQQMPEILPVSIVVEESDIRYVRGGIDGVAVSGKKAAHLLDIIDLPDILGFLQRETQLTRKTLAQILIQSGRLKDFLKNPQDFRYAALQAIQEVTGRLQVANIEYDLIDGMQILPVGKIYDTAEKEIIRHLEDVYKVQNKAKCLWDYIEKDSYNEEKFAQRLDQNPRVKFFMKLPKEYKIDTPVGGYNPDWAVVYQDDSGEHLYLVRETKGTIEEQKLRQEEQDKINCARIHYAKIGVDYKVVTGDMHVV